MAAVKLRARHTTSSEAVARTRSRKARTSIVLIVLLIIVGGWLRFASLGRLSFWADEFPHAIAGRALIHDGRPTLPSGREYRRALAHTVVVAASMRAAGENETGARLPSAIVGLATIPAVWLILRRRFGEPAALAAAAIMAVVPLHVAHSRSARFYVLFVVAYGAAAALGARALLTGSRRAALLAVAAFAAAMHLQVLALMLVAPFFVQALSLWHGAEGRDRARRGRTLVTLCAASVAAAGVALAVPDVRDGALRLLEKGVPGLRLDPGIHLRTLANLFGGVAWWAWIPLAPAAIVGLRRSGRAGTVLAIHLVVPAVLFTVLFDATSGRGAGDRYLIHLLPFVAAVAGVGVAEVLRLLRTTLAERRDETRVAGGAVSVSAVAIAILVVHGSSTVWRITSEDHPGTIIPRPNWNAAGRLIRAEGAPGDGLLTTSPLALSWPTGRCGAFLRVRAAAAPVLVDGRDIYCGSPLVPDASALRRYLARYPRGWVVADPRQWPTLVDPAARVLLERTATRVDAGDRSILVMRWGGEVAT